MTGYSEIRTSYLFDITSANRVLEPKQDLSQRSGGLVSFLGQEDGFCHFLGKAPIDSLGFTARLKPCPFKNWSFTAGC